MKKSNSNIDALSQFKTDFQAPKDWTTPTNQVVAHAPFKKYLRSDIPHIFKAQGVNDPFLEEREFVAQVFPFKINQFTIDQIDWKNYLTDPIFKLTFPQPEMLLKSELKELKEMKKNGATRQEFADRVSDIRSAKNPAPANQAANRPIFEEDDDEVNAIDGLQHKYPKIVLMFHKNAQTCHAYCTYCFRFNQFVGKDKFLEDDSVRLHRYLKEHPEVTDLLMTGGDPATMKSDIWREVLEPLLQPEFNHIRNIRIGTKALTYHPYRFLTEPDADDLIALFKKMKDGGKHIAVMAHFTHYQELNPITLEAARRLREEAGAVIRTQAPLMKGINDSPEVWAKMWQTQVQNGLIPYYMFIARDTGAQQYFEVTLAKALDVYSKARQLMSGLAHTARGPSMSCGPGKVCVLGHETVAGEEVFVLKFLQARNPDWCKRVFFAKYNEKATWIDQLEPAFGEKEFFFEQEFNDIVNKKKTFAKELYQV
jgi:KamA family protein